MDKAELPVTPSGTSPMLEEDLHQMICTDAYFRAERRGFAPGAELQDWLESEQEIKERINVEMAEEEAAAL